MLDSLVAGALSVGVVLFVIVAAILATQASKPRADLKQDD